LVIREKKVIRTFEVEMSNDEILNVYRLLRNEVEGAECCDSTSADMYYKLKTAYENELI
jgi:hypothetical protein